MPKKSKRKRGPKEERLTLTGPWRANVKRAIAKKRPPTGWPKHKKAK